MYHKPYNYCRVNIYFLFFCRGTFFIAALNGHTPRRRTERGVCLILSGKKVESGFVSLTRKLQSSYRASTFLFKEILEPIDYLLEEIGNLLEEVLALFGLLCAAFGAYAVLTVGVTLCRDFGLSLKRFSAYRANNTVGETRFGAGGSLTGNRLFKVTCRTDFLTAGDHCSAVGALCACADTANGASCVNRGNIDNINVV